MNSYLHLLKPNRLPYKLRRIGPNKDGSYILPEDLEGIEACFSPGTNNRKDFEDVLAIKYKIKSFMCDFSSDFDKFETLLIKDMQFFEKKWLDINKSQDSITLEKWVNSNVPNHDSDLLLQMDIEGAEYRNLLAISDSLLKRFRILVIEFHNLTNLVKDKKNKSLENVLKKINKSHLCVHVHPNNCSQSEFLEIETGMNIPDTIECTFLRKDRFLNKKILKEPDLPNINDISNCKWKKPIHLNIKWRKSNKINFKSRLKIIKDYHLWITTILYGLVFKTNLFKLILKKISKKLF